MSMMKHERLEKASRLSRELAHEIRKLVDSTEDYDLLRLAKKIEAELMDVQHNIGLALRIAQDDSGEEA
jgi:hypothetical protein